MLLYVHEFPNGKRYVGVTDTTLEDRIKTGYKGMLVGRAISKYRGRFTSRVILRGPRSVVLRLEDAFIIEWCTQHPGGYNIARGGAFCLMTPEMRDAARDRMSASWADPEKALKLKESMRKAWTPERRAAQAEKARLTGKDLIKKAVVHQKSEEGRKANSERSKKWWSVPENRKKASDGLREWHKRG